MCGIIGFSGQLDATAILLNGLEQLEYRGYDSAGISLNSQNGSFQTIKTSGKVIDLRKKVLKQKPETSSCGIGHTRWATHGGVTDLNAHPHTVGQITLIHNGIIENYNEIAMELAQKGIHPVSQTDSEIAAMLINSLYTGDPMDAICKASHILDGAYAFCIMFKDHPNQIYCTRNASPLVAAHTADGSFIASDMTALIKYTKDYFVVPQQHIALLSKENIRLYTLDGIETKPEMLVAQWDITEAKKNGYAHFMLKEIYDQPESLRSTLIPRIKNGLPDFSEDNIPDELFEHCTRIVITACGTAMHAGLVGKSIIEKMLRIPVSVEAASEFRYQEPIIDKNTLVIIISQSGETADSLAALRLANILGSKTLSIVNVKGSSIARESSHVLYTHAGPEISVASTKAFSVQLAGIYLVCAKLAQISGLYNHEQIIEFTNQLKEIANTVEMALELKDSIEHIANCLTAPQSSFFIGRGLDYCLACEGSLKLKEISYIHSEAYMAGELKHGPISLITEGVPVIAIATQSNTFSKLVSNIREVKARGALLILITTIDNPVDINLCDHLITLPKCSELFTPFTISVAVQLLAYYTSVHRGLDVDQPRNLAKSVTVE